MTLKSGVSVSRECEVDLVAIDTGRDFMHRLRVNQAAAEAAGTVRRCGTCKLWGGKEYSPKAVKRMCRFTLPAWFARMLPAATYGGIQTKGMTADEGMNCFAWLPGEPLTKGGPDDSKAAVVNRGPDEGDSGTA